MPRTTVHFATNRRPDPGAADPARRFGAAMADPGAARLSWGTAFVEGTDPDPRALRTGTIASVEEVTPAAVAADARGDLLGAGKNLLVFVHGFANSFPDAVARAAFNREWLAASGEPEADCAVVAFTWPSAGLVVDPGDLLPGAALSLFTLLGFALSGELKGPLVHRYQTDQGAARSSGLDLAAALDVLAPVTRAVRAQGRRVFLLAHSMGHVVVQNALDAWRAAARPPEVLFDHAVLAAADANAAQAGRAPPWLAAMPAWAAGTSLYLNAEDQILWLSEAVNGTRRLGETGPPDRDDRALFPPDRVRFVACERPRDRGPGAGVDGTHQYYRRVPKVRDDIAAALAGRGAPGASAL